MKKTFTYSIILAIAFTFLTGYANAQFPTIWSTVGSGTWATSSIWETFTGNATNTPGAQGTGTPQTTAVPSGTHHIYIRSGHTVTLDASKNMMSLTIEAGGSLVAPAASNFTLKPANGGTGFTPPFNVTVNNNGTFGNSAGPIIFEIPVTAATVTITGTGTTDLGRIRMRGGNMNSPVLTIDQDITLEQSANHALSAIYNPAVTDNYTVNLNAGKKVTIANPSGYFHSNSIGTGAGFGTYTYNINGTLDLTASTQTLNQLTAISPTGGTVTLNLSGTIKTGAAFNSSPVAPGIGNINVAAGALIDGTIATVMNFNGGSFTMASGTSTLKRTVPSTGAKVNYPVGTSNGSITPVTISNGTGLDDVINVSIKNSFTNPAPANTLPREWNLVEAIGGGNADTLRFEWTIADEAAGFTGTNPVFVGRWNGSAWAFSAASVTGTGTALDPYQAKASGSFSQLGLFILSNTGTTPVALVNVKAYQKLNGIQVEFGNATEENIASYSIEKSADGRSFATAGSLLPKTNNGALNSYSYFDATAHNGNNFYRVKVTERNGNIKYSNILNVRLSGNNGISVYPNPVKGNTLNIQLENLDKATYFVTLMNEVGQKIYTKQLNHDGRTASFVVELPSTLKKGIYSLQVSSNSFTAIKNVVVE
jgi:Secretion system C-terminal sorting domain